MKAEIRNIYSTDVLDLESFIPLIKNNFGFPLRLIIGPKGEPGDESFDLFVCSPRWMEENFSEDAIFYGTHYLIMFNYDYQKMYDKLKNSIESLDLSDWNELGAEIAKLGKWEFEDYID